MKIEEISDKHILFDNGNEITFEHEQECFENNYASFLDIDDISKEIDFDENLIFETVVWGFRFGNPRYMVYVPCYSSQNEYYSNEIDIYYNDKHVIKSFCEIID